MGTRVIFATGVLDEIVRAADASADEVCGLLLGTPGHVEAALPCRNAAADPAIAFEIDPAQLLAAYRAARAGGPTIVGCYHSHPNGVPTPSPRDAAGAEPNGWLWVIVGAGKASVSRAVANGPILGRFDAVSMDGAIA